MTKRYQVFISSTFVDLKEERQQAMRAILEMDHMPAGMELFAAGDDEAWLLIKDVIDASDYYVLIIGGRYGSTDDVGISYTEKEYDYAVEKKKPVIPLLHKKPEDLPRGMTETDEDAWNELKRFRDKVEDKHTCAYWESPEELKAQVLVGFTKSMKRHPGIGWVRSDRLPSEEMATEMLTLQKRVEELEAEAAAERTKPPSGTEHLAQAEDRFGIRLEFVWNSFGIQG